MTDRQDFFGAAPMGQGGTFMGGSPGDGFQGQQQQQQQFQQNQMMQNQQAPNTPGYPPSYSQPTPANTPAGFATPQRQQSGDTGYQPGTGSITRFATPQQQPGTPLYPQSSPSASYNFSPPPQPAGAGGGGGGMSYTQRAAMLQQRQQPQYAPQPQGMVPQYGQAQQQVGGMYGQPQKPPPPQQQQQQQPGMYGQPQQQQLSQPGPYGQQPAQQQPVQQQQQQGGQFGQGQVQQQSGQFGTNQQAQQQQKPPPSAPPQNTAGMSFAQRSAMMQQQRPQSHNVYRPQQKQQPSMANTYQYQGQPNAAPNVTTQQQQQQQPGQPQYANVPQQQPPRPHQQQQQQQPPAPPQPGNMAGASQPPMAGSSYAERSAMAHSVGGGAVGQSTMMPPQGQQQQQLPPPPQGQPPLPGQQQQPPRPNALEDPPEVVAQQNRLLTNATRKVQEHAYYMKQAMERHDLPAVLDRAASMVGELGEHAHAHHHGLHPPAPGATGSTTALSPKNYYELHLRALEELPTLEDYLLNLAKGSAGVPQIPPAGAPNPMATPAPMGADPLAMGAVPPNQGMMPNMMPQQQQQFQQPNQPPPAIPPSFSMKELYDYVQYCPNVLSRLYLQVCAASALIRSGEVGARWVLKDMIEAVKCVQNPVRGLFLRHYLLQAIRDKLPNESIPLDQVGGPITPASLAESKNAMNISPSIAADVENVEKGTVKDSYEFILANFIEMNKLWVRIQHLPGDGKSKEIRRRREKDRNELRILVGTNLVRLSALESVTSSIYGQVILPTVLEHIVICGDPLAQAYLIDCIVQVFPDEYHIETMPILLGVCPKLRDKVNIRTILQALMDRLANYLADEELLDEKDSNQVKRSLARDSFRMFDECVQNVFNARGPKLQAKEVIRLQTALLSFTLKCYQGNMEHITLCLNHCVVGLQQASANRALMQDGNMNSMVPPPARIPLDEAATKELEKLLSIPLDELALGVLNLDHYADLITFLPWSNRRQVALNMLKSVCNAGEPPQSVKEIEELFSVIAPVLRDEHDPAPVTNENTSVNNTTNLMAGLGVSSPQAPRAFGQGSAGPTLAMMGGPNDIGGGSYNVEDTALVSKLINILDHSNTDVAYEMLVVARNHLNSGNWKRTNLAYSAMVFASLKLATRIFKEELESIAGGEEEAKTEEKEPEAETKEEKGDKEVEAETKEEEETKEANADGAEVETVTDADGDAKPEVVATEPTESAEPEKTSDEKAKEQPREPKVVGCRKVFVFIQQIIANISKAAPETGVKLYLECALAADKMGSKSKPGVTGHDAFGQISYELISQSFALYEENSGDSKLQVRCVVAMIGTLLACRSVSKQDYESLIMKTAQYSAKMLKKSDQCEMVASCSYLFYVVGDKGEVVYSNPQRGLECLQRALKLADACTSTNPGHVNLFVDLLDHYLYFFEKKNPSITGNYISGLVALIKEHTDSLSQFGGSDPSSPVGEAKAHFLQTVGYIKRMKEKEETAEHYATVDVSCVSP